MCVATPTTGATQVVELTPPGRGAVAVVLVTGPGAVEAVEGCFTSVRGRSVAALPIGLIALGRWGGPEGEELIVCRRAADQVEVHCHGGRAAVRAVVDALAGRGCRLTSWTDWLGTQAADPIRTAARLSLADARTARTAAVLVDQHQGALGTAIRQTRGAVLAGDWAEAARTLDAVLARADVGRHLTSPWKVVLAGPTNVGKSSLANALAGYERAIVSDLPGTTRDVVTTTTAIDGWPVELADTAGLRATGDELEAAGVARATAALTAADLVVVIADATDPVEDSDLLARLSATTLVLRVWNKIDLLTSPDERARLSSRGPVPPLLTSALTGEGLASLVAAVGRALVPAAPAAGSAVPFTADLIVSLEMARAAVDRQGRSAASSALADWLAE